MEDDTNIHGSTLRVLASLLALGFDIAREKAADLIERMRPLVEPPDDLRVTSRYGVRYSGLVVLDRGEIIAGIVVAAGHDPVATTAAGLPQRVHVTPPATAFGSMREEKLPHWSEDPRELYRDEDPPWRR